MSTSPDCPSETTLRLLGSDYLGDATFSTIEAHVESCPRCRETLERIVRTDHELGEPYPHPTELPEIPGFVVERELGRGSAGVVYLASEPGLERQVALKLVPGGALAGPKQRARWMSEARAVSRLRHPNIVRLYRVDETEVWLAMVFEYIPGGTLKDLLASLLDPRDAARLVETIARATAHIHEKGLLHLDLKPSNILLDGFPNQGLADAVPKISDFGIARIASDLDQSLGTHHGPRGTPSYMSPEQAEGKPERIGPASDVYALGAILYEMLTGRPPFRSDSVAETLERIRRESPVPPHRIRKEVPKTLDAICRKALARDPRDRHESAQDLADDLRAWLEDRPVRGLGRSVRRDRITAALILGALLVSAGWASFANRASDALIKDRGEWIRRLQTTNLPTSGSEFESIRRSVEHHTTELLRDPTVDADGLASIAVLERKYSDVYMHEREGFPVFDALLDSSSRLLTECLRRRTDDQEFLWELTLCELAAAAQHGAINVPLVDVRMRHARRAADLIGRIKQTDRRIEGYKNLFFFELNQIKQLKYLGHLDASDSVLNTVIELLDQVDPSDAQTGDLTIIRHVMREQRGSVKSLYASKELLTDQSRRWYYPREKNQILSESIAGPLGDSIFRLNGPFVRGTRAEQEAEAREVVARVELGCAEGGLEVTAIVKAVTTGLLAYVSGISSKEREAGRIDRAEAIARGYLTFCETLAAKHPDRSDVFQALSQAHLQVAKNAWKRSDDEGARVAIVKSRDAARRAASLAPQDLVARALVEDRERRLARALGEGSGFNWIPRLMGR